MMEHRYFPRIPVKYRVTIHQQGQPVVIAETQNISKFGMFVKTVGLDCRINSYFKIEVASKVDTKKRISARALVVHRNDEGIGLTLDSMFELWPEVYESNKIIREPSIEQALKS